MWAFISPCAFSNAVLQMQAFNAWQSPNILAHKWGGGGGPPWGEFNGIGFFPRTCANSVLDWFPTGSVQSQLANLDILSSSSFAQFDLKCSFPYPFLSPGAWGPPQTRRQKAEKFGFFAFLVDFFAFRTALEKWYRKNIEKNAKIEDFGLPKPSQNRPEILPKSMFQKTYIFSELFNNFFLIFKTSKPWKYQFYLRKITIFKVFAKIVFLQLSCIFGQKNLPKTLPKRGPNPSKIDAKNMLFFNIHFYTFWHRFWRVLGLQVGAKLAQNASADDKVAYFWTFLS